MPRRLVINNWSHGRKPQCPHVLHLAPRCFNLLSNCQAHFFGTWYDFGLELGFNIFNCCSRCTRCGPTSHWPTFTMHHACKLSCTPQWFVTDVCFITAPHWWSFPTAIFVARIRDVKVLFPPKRQRRPSLFRLVIGFVFKARVVRFLTAASPSPLGCCGIACSVLETHSARMRLNAAPETSGPVGVSASWQLRVTAKEKESESPWWNSGRDEIAWLYLEMQRQSNQTPALLWSLFKAAVVCTYRYGD